MASISPVLCLADLRNMCLCIQSWCKTLALWNCSQKTQVLAFMLWGFTFKRKMLLWALWKRCQNQSVRCGTDYIGGFWNWGGKGTPIKCPTLLSAVMRGCFCVHSEHFLGLDHNSWPALFSRLICLDYIVSWDTCNRKGLIHCKYSYTDRKWEVMSNKSKDVTMQGSEVPK